MSRPIDRFTDEIRTGKYDHDPVTNPNGWVRRDTGSVAYKALSLVGSLFGLLAVGASMLIDKAHSLITGDTFEKTAISKALDQFASFTFDHVDKAFNG